MSVCVCPMRFSVFATACRKVVEKVLAEAPRGKKSEAAFLKRLSKIAKGLPPTYIEKVFAQMKHRIKSIVDADGFVPKFD